MARYFVEFWDHKSHRGTRALSAGTLESARTEAKFYLHLARETDASVEFATLFDNGRTIDDNVEVIETLQVY